MPVMGITRIADVTGLDVIGIPVVMVFRPNSRSIAVSQGKGQDLMAARASGLMESIETYHAEHIALPLLLASYEELRLTHNLVDISALPVVSGSAWDPNATFLWIEGHDLLNDESVWVPYEIVHTNYTLPRPPHSGVFAASSNGLASGNHLLEAISHGITEVVERDATTLWHHLSTEEKAETRIDLDTIDDPGCRELLEKFQRADIGVAVWETTTDIGLSSYYCMIMQRQDEAQAAVGAGCHRSRANGSCSEPNDAYFRFKR
jgi:ribosomal protein S12 methylthiotransferase accessory factor